VEKIAWKDWILLSGLKLQLIFLKPNPISGVHYPLHIIVLWILDSK
jgi:hypothetical protein